MQISCVNNAVSRNKNDSCQVTLARKLTPNRLTISEYKPETGDRNPNDWSMSHQSFAASSSPDISIWNYALFSIFLFWWLFSYFSSSHFVISLSAVLLVMICKIYTTFLLYSRYGVKNHQQFCRWERQHLWARKKKEM